MPLSGFPVDTDGFSYLGRMAGCGCPQKIDVQSTLDALLAESKRTKSDYRKAALHALDSSIVAIASIEGCDDVRLMSKVVPVVAEVLKSTPARVDDIDSGVGAAGSFSGM